VRYALSLSNWLSPVAEPRSGGGFPPYQNIKQKNPKYCKSSQHEYFGVGGFLTPHNLPYKKTLYLKKKTHHHNKKKKK
ncbi:hypothetical protein ACVGWW_00375, partial [Enterobacter hormaechei]